MDTIRELLSLLIIRQLALHPDGIAVRRISISAVYRAVATTLKSVVALARTGRLPIKINISSKNTAGDSAGLGVALALGLGLVLLQQGLLVAGDGVRGRDGVGHGLVETPQVRHLHPLVLNGLQLIADLARSLRGEHEVVQGLQVGVRAADDEGVVARVNGRRDQGSGLGVRSGDRHEVRAHDVSLGADGHEAVDVLADGHQNFTGHVSALLRSGGLVFDVDAGGAVLDEELGELHYGGEAAVAGVGIGDEGAEVIDVREL